MQGSIEGSYADAQVSTGNVPAYMLVAECCSLCACCLTC